MTPVQTRLPLNVTRRALTVDRNGTVYVNNKPGLLVLAPGAAAPSTVPLTGEAASLVRMSTDRAGAVYLTTGDQNGIFKLPAGSMTPQKLPISGGNLYADVAVDSGGTVYATDFIADDDGKYWIQVLAPGATSARRIPFGTTGRPVAIAVDSSGGVYVANLNAGQVVKLDPATGKQQTLPFNGIQQANGVGVDASGTVYALDFKNNRVLALQAGSSSQKVLPFQGLSNPYDMAVAPDGTVYVSDDSGVIKLEHPLS
ncbi:MAG: PQQ-binding-like beta-propeller repeat protein [Mycolicibacterium insubricum]